MALKNPSFIAPFGKAATSFGVAWMPQPMGRRERKKGDRGMSQTNKSKKLGGMDGLIAMARRLEQVKAQARRIGIFTHDRELLECPNCGLLEDVMADGLPVTYSRRSRNRKDCGLRFSQVDENCFQCPSCGTKISA